MLGVDWGHRGDVTKSSKCHVRSPMVTSLGQIFFTAQCIFTGVKVVGIGVYFFVFCTRMLSAPRACVKNTVCLRADYCTGRTSTHRFSPKQHRNVPAHREWCQDSRVLQGKLRNVTVHFHRCQEVVGIGVFCFCFCTRMLGQPREFLSQLQQWNEFRS